VLSASLETDLKNKVHTLTSSCFDHREVKRNNRLSPSQKLTTRRVLQQLMSTSVYVADIRLSRVAALHVDLYPCSGRHIICDGVALVATEKTHLSS